MVGNLKNKFPKGWPFHHSGNDKKKKKKKIQFIFVFLSENTL